MNKKIAFIIIILFFFTLISSGCLDFIIDGSTTYQSHPIKIRYDIRYGYEVDCDGTGKYEIHYNCDKPEALLGSIFSLNLLYNNDYTNIELANNSIIFWNMSGKGSSNYELGITATVQVESFLVSDLNGVDSLTTQGIDIIYPNLVNQYCRKQTAGDKTYIDPDYASIKNTANIIQYQANSNNAFVLAKELFVWLKENTEYQIHNNKAGVQPASETYQLRTGDCDDLSFLYMSLCRSIGIPARFIRGYLIDVSNEFASVGSHAWVEVFVGGGMGNDGWIPVECACSAGTNTEIHQNFGVEDAYHLRLFVDDGSNESIEFSMSSISWTYGSNIEITADPFIEIDNYTVLEEKQLVVTKDNVRSYQ